MRDASTQTAPPLKLREQAYNSFTRLLLSQEIRPGQFISQRELVEMTGLPLGAIRELIPRLEVDGLLSTVPQRGMQITHIDLNLIRNAYQFRLFLEREAAAFFVETAPERMLIGMRDAHRAVLDRAAEGLDPEVLTLAQKTDWAFHDTIIGFLENEIISNHYRVNSVKIQLIRLEQARLYDALVVPVMEEHMRIIDVFFERDPARAAIAISEHIAIARNRALRI